MGPVHQITSRIVAAAAARHLTPTLLELVGRVRSAARRIAWGGITGNAGQMCICQYYVAFRVCARVP
jgi:acyl-CoA reductase-like NAD-dependent aldehyde dehydrogenase